MRGPKRKNTLPSSPVYSAAFFAPSVQKVLGRWQEVRCDRQKSEEHTTRWRLAFPIKAYQATYLLVGDDTFWKYHDDWLWFRLWAPCFMADLLKAVTDYACLPESEWSLTRRMEETEDRFLVENMEKHFLESDRQTAAEIAGFDLRLLSASDLPDIPTAGTRLVVIARNLPDDTLTFRVFNAEGRTVVNASETAFPHKTHELAELKDRLNCLWEQETLPVAQKTRILESIASITNPIPWHILTQAQRNALTRRFSGLPSWKQITDAINESRHHECSKLSGDRLRAKEFYDEKKRRWSILTRWKRHFEALDHIGNDWFPQRTHPFQPAAAPTAKR